MIDLLADLIALATYAFALSITPGPNNVMLAASGAAGPNVVSAGVATALWATAAGLVVAIPSVVAYNVFRNKAKRIMTDMEVVSREILALFRVEQSVRLKAIA